MKGKKAIAYLKEVDDLGEFKFIFTETPKEDIGFSTGKYSVDSYFSIPNYGEINFLEGYYVNDIDKEIEELEKEDGMYGLINCARISCECNVEFTDDVDGMNCGILMEYFGYEEEAIEKLIFEGMQEREKFFK